VVLPHQHSLGDSGSLSDSLCRTGCTRFYSAVFLLDYGNKTTIPYDPLVYPCVHVGENLPSESFEQLAMPHFERLYNFACWLTHDRQEAEDLVQETYAKALKGFPSFQPGTNFRAWIYKILRNAFLSSRTG